ncbi:MAG: hypothetical protein IKX20_02760 [Paludibacteraceae bacterium]|nr:hypothetical protein [Paludibacteraceae bacterium]
MSEPGEIKRNYTIPEGTRRESFGNGTKRHKMPLEDQCAMKSANSYYKRKAMKHRYIDD